MAKFVAILLTGALAASPAFGKPPQGSGKGSMGHEYSGQEHSRAPERVHRDLPKGLQKKIQRGGRLPPGWEMLLNKGEVLDDAIYQHGEPVPDSMKAKLPRAKKGMVEIKVEGKVIRLIKATHEIVDVFDVE